MRERDVIHDVVCAMHKQRHELRHECLLLVFVRCMSYNANNVSAPSCIIFSIKLCIPFVNHHFNAWKVM